MKGFTENISELSEAWQDYFNWKRHVEEKKRIANDPDIFKGFESAKTAGKSLICDFDEEPEDSVITIFKTDSGKFKIDAISNHNEFELHRDEYDPEDVVALVFFRDGEPFVKQMKSINS